MLTVKKLNESFSVVDGELEELRIIFDFLKVERPGAYFEEQVKAGLKSPFDFFASIQHEKLLVMNGHVQLLKNFGINDLDKTPDYTEKELDEFLHEIKKILPFPPYDFQEKAFKESIFGLKQINKMCTSSGKSLVISLIAEFFRRRGKKGLLLVPNINLLAQFSGDIQSYNLPDLHNSVRIIGGGSKDDYCGDLIISTWQSMKNNKSELESFDYIMCDELHRFASLETSAIVRETLNCNYKFGFTGTLPESPVAKMQLIGLFGLPKVYITSRELIDRGLATPVLINSIILNYTKDEKKIFKEIQPTGRSRNKYPQQLAFIKEHEKRNDLVINLSCKLKATGNTLLLFQHTVHGKEFFIRAMKKLHPDVEVKNKNITGKKSFEFQQQYGVYFLNGEDDAKTRELTRKILETHKDALLIANYAILSTGVNIKRLHNLVFGSPMKSHTTIAQSIGRLMRLYPGKTLAQVFDIIDATGLRGISGIFYQQYKHRLATSYNVEEFPIKEKVVNL